KESGRSPQAALYTKPVAAPFSSAGVARLSGHKVSFETDFTGRVKAGPQIETWQGRSAAAFTPAVILFIALPEAEDNIEPGVIPLECLPRRCPVCRADTIIGHGRRRRQCHDDQHECIWVRRGL